MEVSRDVSTESIQSGAFTMGFMEIPVFSGDDLRPWINWMENRFAAEDFTDDQKMALAYAVIRGEAESWYNNRVSRRPFQNWKDLKDAMFLRRQNAPLFRDGRRHLFAFPEVSSPESVPSPAHTTVDGMTRSQSEWTFHRLLKEMSGSKKAAPVAAKAASSSDSSEEDSDEESEDEKPAPKAKQDTKSAKKDSSSDKSGSDESESEDEEETPKKTCSDVEMVDAEMKQVKNIPFS
ncbi:hypothetical protein Bca101_036972 [Brassica carinata]